MIERKLLVTARLGLHARAAARLVRIASQFESKVVLRRLDNGAGAAGSVARDQGVDAKSILSVLMLAATFGTELEARAEGIDEAAAMEAVAGLFSEAFGEVEAEPVK
jgi:phosphocarrier protein HPr